MSKTAFPVDVSGREHLEEWRPIPRFEGFYEASNLGRVRSVTRRVIDARNERIFKGKVLSQRVADTGYVMVQMSKGGRACPQLVHRLVLEAFCGEAPDGYVCCHHNGVRADNRIENLRWDTRSANEADKHRHGTRYPEKCRRGHPFTDSNTIMRASGKRLCRECKLANSRAWYHQRKKSLL